MGEYADLVAAEILAALDENPNASPEEVAERLIALGLATPAEGDGRG